MEDGHLDLVVRVCEKILYVCRRSSVVIFWMTEMHEFVGIVNATKIGICGKYVDCWV